MKILTLKTLCLDDSLNSLSFEFHEILKLINRRKKKIADDKNFKNQTKP